MKFHCPACNAKYRISDDKLAARPNARLRCKQCSELFGVREAVEAEQRREVAVGEAAAEEGAAPNATPVRAEPPKPARLKSVPKAAATRSALPSPRGTLPRPPQTSSALPRPGIKAAAPALSRAALPKPMGKLPRPSVPPPPGGAAVARELRELPAPPEPSLPEEDRQSSVTEADAELKGWFAEVNGKSEGPLKPEALRRRLSSGEIASDTLVWREDREDWEPVAQVPALCRLLPREDDAETAQAPAVKPEQAGSSGPELPSAGSEPKKRDLPAPPPVGAQRREESPPAPEVEKEAPPEPAEEAAPRRPLVASVPMPDELKLASAEATSTPMSHLGAGYAPPRGPKMVPAALAYGATLVALLFGLGAGYLLFGSTQADVRYVQGQAPDERGALEHAPPPPPSEVAAAEPGAPEPAAGTPGEQVPEPTPSSQGSVAVAKRSARSGATEAPVEEGPKGSLLSGLDAIGPGGPAVGATTDSKTSSSLEAAAIQKTVQRYQSSVRRSCWQRALRASGASTTARVSVTINIAPSGNVTSASTSGDPTGYPGLASCIQSKVKNWRFPRAAGPTTTRVPFVFAAQ